MGLQTIRKTAWLGIMAGILWLALITAGLGGLKISAEEADGSVSASIVHRHDGSEENGGSCFRELFMSIPRRRDVTVPSAVRLPYMETAASGRRGMHTATAMDRYMKYIRMSLKNTAPAVRRINTHRYILQNTTVRERTASKATTALRIQIKNWTAAMKAR